MTWTDERLDDKMKATDSTSDRNGRDLGDFRSEAQGLLEDVRAFRRDMTQEMRAFRRDFAAFRRRALIQLWFYLAVVWIVAVTALVVAVFR